jgi:hypothetical protein
MTWNFVGNNCWMPPAHAGTQTSDPGSPSSASYSYRPYYIVSLEIAQEVVCMYFIKRYALAVSYY